MAAKCAYVEKIGAVYYVRKRVKATVRWTVTTVRGRIGPAGGELGRICPRGFSKPGDAKFRHGVVSCSPFSLCLTLIAPPKGGVIHGTC